MLFWLLEQQYRKHLEVDQQLSAGRVWALTLNCCMYRKVHGFCRALVTDPAQTNTVMKQNSHKNEILEAACNCRLIIFMWYKYGCCKKRNMLAIDRA